MDNFYIDKVLSGDAQSFKYFVTTYKDMAFSIAISVVKQGTAAEEVVQEAFVQAYFSLSTFNRQSKFITWFYRIVIRCSYKYLRSTSSKYIYLDLNNHDQIQEEGAEHSVLKKEKSHLINHALTKISPDECLVLRLFYLEEFSLKEVAEVTNWTISKVKTTLFRARKNLRVELSRILKKHEC